MFFYYGAKNQLARYYPAPEWGLVVEPFAGSAGYSQYWRKSIRQAVLFDADERVVELWHQLQKMSAAEIAELPVPNVGEYYVGMTDMLIKMCAASNGVMKMSGSLACPKRVVEVWPMMIRRMAERVDDVRDWAVVHGDYTEADEYVRKHFPARTKATWFIDPPYSPQITEANAGSWHRHGEGYRESEIDYEALGRWSDQLSGQVIVCEMDGAKWRSGFQPLRTGHNSQGRASKEVIASWLTVNDPDSGKIRGYKFDTRTPGRLRN